MKPKVLYPKQDTRRRAAELRDAPSIPAAAPGASAMVRTQIYLSRPEYDFLQAEVKRQDLPMAAIIRSLIEERMAVPEEAWRNNPLLEPPADDPDYKPRGDGVVNHDHYIYGGPKKYGRVKGRRVLLPPLE